MNPVSSHLRNLLSRQVADHGLVVWFDPERQYERMLPSLKIPDATILLYDGSFFALRHAADEYVEAGRPHLVVYVPIAEEETEHALVELTAPGSVMKPGHASRARNTRLSVVARAALQPYHTEEELAAIVQQTEAGKLHLDDLDRLAEGGKAVVLSVIFSADDPEEIALRFLEGDRFDAEIARRNALDDLSGLLAATFGLHEPAQSLDGLRAQLALQLLATEFVASLFGEAPSQLTGVGAREGAQRQACIAAAVSWRRDRGRRERYADWSCQVESDLSVATLSLAPETVWNAETFVVIDALLQETIERRLADLRPLAESEIARYRDLIRARLSDFWSSWPERFDEVRPRWEAISTILELLYMADTVATELKSVTGGPAELLDRYAIGERPWCLLDTYFRRLEQHSHTFDLVHRYPTLERAVNRARHRYMSVGGDVAERFTHALSDAKYDVAGALRQTQIYRRHVAPAIEEGRTAYVFVDAFRFEMALEQSERFAAEHDVSLAVAVAAAPTLTPVGMAALLPGADAGLTLVQIGASGIAVQLGATRLAVRKDRVDFFRRVHPQAVTVTLEEVLSSRSKELTERLRSAPVALITSQEIDALAEGDNIHQAWLLMEYVLGQVGRLVNRLRDHGYETIIVAADHGYLFAEELESDMKIDPPGGETIGLHRRAWIGRGGGAEPEYLRAPLATLGIGSDFELATPWGFGVFKTPGGARAYFHGGLSPQELAIPVLTVRPHGATARPGAGDITWEIALGSKSISTRYCAVTISGVHTGLFRDSAPAVRLEIRAGGVSIARPIAAAYGLDDASGDITLRILDGAPPRIEANTVTLAITTVPSAAQASIHLLDAVTGRELATPLTVPLAIQEY